MAKEGEIWACSACRSINTKRSGTCYRCHAPRTLTGASPLTLATIGHEATPAAVHPYRGAGVRALLVILGLMVAYVGTTALIFWLFPPLRPLAEAQGEVRSFKDAPWIFAAWSAMVLIVTVFWAAWISRVVDNLPALGLGYLRASPRTAFFESLLIGPNIYFGPARVGEVMRRLDRTGRGPALIYASWLAVVAPFAALAVYVRFGRWAVGSIEMGREIATLVPWLWGVSTVGFFLAMVAVLRVERLSRARLANGPA